MSESPRPNRLLQESSPYLRQHASNPVNWYPWGPEALARARQEDRPIFLSIGYSACHWCHVMEHESFEDADTARLMNEYFINIKVDREERPDLDQIYMNAVTSLTGHGGWPMSVFLTPDLRPFYAGTYFPPVSRHGLPGFSQVLTGIVQIWQSERGRVNEVATQVTAHVQELGRIEPATSGELTEDYLKNAAGLLQRAFDRQYGGFGRAPKFPHPMELKLLLRAWRRFGDESALVMARLTLDRMAMGGMYDQLGGGFHRYSTDARWLVPHFEKMLYDNALLTQSYLEAYQATADPFYREVAVDTLAWVQRDMQSPEGGFYSTLDADSEGHEGKFYVWSLEELAQLLGADLADVFSSVYDVSPSGNWEGQNILNRTKTYAQEAKLLRLSEEELGQKLAGAKRKLLEVRNRRVWPGRDEKMLTAWNALMIDAYAQAAQVLDESYLAPAVRAAEFLLATMRGPDGRLFRTYSSGSGPKLNAYLEDYSFLTNALVTLYEASFDPRWLRAAVELADVMVDQFWDAGEGGFFFTGRDHEQLIVRGKDPQDHSIPSGNALAVLALLRLGHLAGRGDLADKAEQTLRLFQPLMAQSPMAAGQMLVNLDFFLGPVQEFAVLGSLSDTGTRAALQLIRGPFRPSKVVAARDGSSGDEVERLIPLLAGKTALGGQVTAYLCQGFTCQAPWVGLDAIRKGLAETR